MDLEWSQIAENKITLLNHNLHDFPPFDPYKTDEKGVNIPMWKDDIREKVGWVSEERYPYENEITFW